jgi:hypothetical protein
VGNIYLKLGGPGSDKPKAPASYGWQSPGFQGLGAPAVRRILDAGGWIGMRCDPYVVIDCDDEHAANYWLDRGPDATWTRSTPHGMHFIYHRTADSPDASLIRPIKGVNLDVLAGSGRQIVLWADGYETISPDQTTAPFNLDWLPATAFLRKDHSEEAWDEMPEGRGNDTLTAIGGVMRRHGASYEVILKALAGINKLTMTTDPMPIEQIDQIARSVCRYSPASMQDIVLVEK